MRKRTIAEDMQAPVKIACGDTPLLPAALFHVECCRLEIEVGCALE
jgi:hypothetical protein